MTSEAPKNVDPEPEERGRILQFAPRPAAKPAVASRFSGNKSAGQKTSAFANLSRDAEMPRGSGSSVRGLEKYSREADDQDDFSHRMKMNALAAIVLLALIGGGMWIVDVMTQMRQNQDCVLSGRRNCTAIAQPSGSRVP